MARYELTAYGKLIRNKLVALGVSVDQAEQIIGEQRIAHQYGPKKRDVEYLPLAMLTRTGLRGLRLAEHIASVVANWRRCYTVDTTAMCMRACAAE